MRLLHIKNKVMDTIAHMLQQSRTQVLYGTHVEIALEPHNCGFLRVENLYHTVAPNQRMCLRR